MEVVSLLIKWLVSGGEKKVLDWTTNQRKDLGDAKGAVKTI